MSNPNREHRSKFANERRRRPPTTPASSSSNSHQSESFDYEVSNTHSGEYTDRAEEYATSHFPIPTRRMFEHFDTLRQRRFENTRRVDFDTLRAFGIEEQFLYLTGRIGFTPAFWNIEHNSYQNLTHEFLSSLRLTQNKRDIPYVKFQLGRRHHCVWVSQLRDWFGFHPNPETSLLEFREEMDKDKFWNLITGMQTGSVQNSEYISLNIPHPVLRCIMRALAVTIFARGETISRANIEDLQLLDHMLRPDNELVRPDLMLSMIHHWLGLQRSTRTGGNITIGGYATLIADQLGVPTTDDILCKGPTILNAEAFRLAQFIKVEKGTAGHSSIYTWIMPDGGTKYQMPFLAHGSSPHQLLLCHHHHHLLRMTRPCQMFPLHHLRCMLPPQPRRPRTP